MGHYYLLDENMRECTAEELHSQKKFQYAAVLTTLEWEAEWDLFDLGIDLDLDLDIEGIHNTKAEVNYDSLTGSFQIPDRNNLQAPPACFAFALDEKGIVFIDCMCNSGIYHDENGETVYSTPIRVSRILRDVAG